MRKSRGVAVLLLAAGIGAGLAAPAGAASRAELDALSQKVSRVESLREIKDVQKQFAQLAQFGEFKKMAALFAANGKLQWGDEVATGRKAITNWLTSDAGAMDGIAPGSLNFMIIDNPSINLSADGQTAQGRWNGLRFMGDGNGATRIAGGIYENDYVLEDGDWKIADLHYYRQFDGDYAQGWRNSDNALLPVVPYHFTPDSVGVPIPAASVPATRTNQRPEDLLGRTQALNDEDDVRNLQHSYGAYVDRRMWSDVVDLFADNGTLTITGVGTFQGADGIRQVLEQTMGSEGLTQSILNEHPIWDTLVDVKANGKRAITRGMEMGMLTSPSLAASWSFSVFRNTVVKQDGVWKLKDVTITPLITADWAEGWGNGGTGPQVHQEPPAFINLSRDDVQAADTAPSVAGLTRQLGRSWAWDGVENVNNSYGYFFDDLDCARVGAIHAANGFKESPFQGFFQTPARITEACFVAWGRTQPELRSRLSYHWQPEPVILVSHDGRSARSRARLFQPGTSRNLARGISGAIYNNQFIYENGIWKIWDTTIDEHYYTSSLTRAWSAAVPRDPTLPPPPPSGNIARYPPDILLRDMNEREVGFNGGTLPYIVWPDILPMWFNYRNLVTGRVPQFYQPDCTPCGLKPSWSMVHEGYQLPPNGPNADGVDVFPTE
jgi:hypothetical protein